MLSTDEQKEQTNQYLKWQREYNITKDPAILWQKLRPLLISMIGNCVKKKCKHHFIDEFEWRVENQAERVIKRYIDNPSYNRELPMTIAYWEAVNMLYGSSYDKLTACQLDDDNELHYDEGEEDIKIIDVGGNRILFDYDTNEFSIIKAGDKTDEVIEALEKEGKWRLSLTNKYIKET